MEYDAGMHKSLPYAQVLSINFKDFIYAGTNARFAGVLRLPANISFMLIRFRYTYYLRIIDGFLSPRVGGCFCFLVFVYTCTRILEDRILSAERGRKSSGVNVLYKKN